MLLLRWETSKLQSYLSMARSGRQRCMMGEKKRVVSQLHIQSRQPRKAEALLFCFFNSERLNIFPLNSLD